MTDDKAELPPPFYEELLVETFLAGLGLVLMLAILKRFRDNE